ncbi:STAS domain-containing protein [Herpetosiphon giganteus]|uniref:STAS domain-containing protein n=1 Tax=Herpetosiphon giganteus TaxID=2029754 RepID=UPI00195B85B0|nr:STAS domain-containing protein [Herpetosiphon giganteus]MBM7844878.1 anti-anti-sigma regulatory factor [Herpetosiphon giganteus]
MSNSAAEIAALKAEIAELQAQLAHAQQQAALFENVVKHLPIGIDLLQREDVNDPTSFRLIFSNGLMPNATIDLRLHIGKLLNDIFPDIPLAILNRYHQALNSGETMHLNELVMNLPEVGQRIAQLTAIPLSSDLLCIKVADITEQKQVLEAQRQMLEQQAVIHSQQEALADISTPLIPITDSVVIMPLIGAVDTRRAQQMLETLLHGISTMNTRFAILDITGVPIVDTQVAHVLIQAAQSVRLLGGQVILTGIRPEVAQTLVGLGVNLNDLIVRGNLQSGVAYATLERSR